MCGGWLLLGGVLVLAGAALVVLHLARALDVAESQLDGLRRTQAKVRRERDHLFDQVNRLQEARLERELLRLDEGGDGR